MTSKTTNTGRKACKTAIKTRRVNCHTTMWHRQKHPPACRRHLPKSQAVANLHYDREIPHALYVSLPAVPPGLSNMSDYKYSNNQNTAFVKRKLRRKVRRKKNEWGLNRPACTTKRLFRLPEKERGKTKDRQSLHMYQEMWIDVSGGWTLKIRTDTCGTGKQLRSGRCSREWSGWYDNTRLMCLMHCWLYLLLGLSTNREINSEPNSTSAIFFVWREHVYKISGSTLPWNWRAAKEKPTRCDQKICEKNSLHIDSVWDFLQVLLAWCISLWNVDNV
jgi:hypothetical protein